MFGIVIINTKLRKSQLTPNKLYYWTYFGMMLNFQILIESERQKKVIKTDIRKCLFRKGKYGLLNFCLHYYKEAKILTSLEKID